MELIIKSVPFIGFEEADSLLNWTGVSDALYAGHKLTKALNEDVYLEHESKGYFNRAAFIPGLGMATKSVSVFPDNRNASPPRPAIQGAVLLFDDEGGQLLAVLDGELVTKWKTTADSILGARLLARPNPRNLVLVGAGTVGSYSLEAYCELFPSLENIAIWNRTSSSAEQLAAKHVNRPQRIHVTENLAESVAHADIVSCATMSSEPVVAGSWVSAGCHVDLIGAFLPHMREVDDELILASKVFVDSRRSTFNDIGEIAIPLNEGTITETHILGDYYDLCNQARRSRTQNEITLFKNGGGGHLDLMCAQHIYEQYQQTRL